MGDLAARGRARLASGHPGDAGAPADRGGSDLWRGEPYADWPDAAFAEAERRRLTEVRSGAVAGTARGAARRWGRHADVVPELERLVAEEPLREDWWRLLMLALYRAGRQADALAAGTPRAGPARGGAGRRPGPALRAMEAAILAQDPALDPPGRPRRPARGRAGRRARCDLPVQGPGRLPGRRTPPVPRPTAPGGRPGGPARRHAAARGLRAERGREVLRRPCRAGSGPGRRRATRQRAVAAGHRHPRPDTRSTCWRT